MAKPTQSSAQAAATGLKPFHKGQTGNPGGLPHWVREVRALAGEHSPRALERLSELMEQKKNPAIALAAAMAILDRAGLKPISFEPEKHEHTGPGGQPLLPAVDHARVESAIAAVSTALAQIRRAGASTLGGTNGVVAGPTSLEPAHTNGAPGKLPGVDGA